MPKVATEMQHMEVVSELLTPYRNFYVRPTDSSGQTLEQQVIYWRTKYETLRDGGATIARAREQLSEELFGLRMDLENSQERYRVAEKRAAGLYANLQQVASERDKLRRKFYPSALRDRQMKVLSLRKAGRTFVKIAKYIGVSPNRARQIYIQALKRDSGNTSEGSHRGSTPGLNQGKLD